MTKDKGMCMIRMTWQVPNSILAKLHLSSVPSTWHMLFNLITSHNGNTLGGETQKTTKCRHHYDDAKKKKSVGMSDSVSLFGPRPKDSPLSTFLFCSFAGLCWKQGWYKRGLGKAPDHVTLRSEAQRREGGDGGGGAEFMASEVQNNHKS